MVEVKEIDLDRARELHDSDDALFVDIRDPASYETAHIPGAQTFDEKTIEDFLEKADRERTLVVYCYHGNSSLQGAAFFQDQGFKDVYSLTGGFEAWRLSHPHTG